ncbi:hypothetical protein CU044_4297 [Streptomyces sp. L-9-10]|nr:hypothetical protein CU044_4297 [Streptomyces sp. L-9-10]
MRQRPCRIGWVSGQLSDHRDQHHIWHRSLISGQRGKIRDAFGLGSRITQGLDQAQGVLARHRDRQRSAGRRSGHRCPVQPEQRVPRQRTRLIQSLRRQRPHRQRLHRRDRRTHHISHRDRHDAIHPTHQPHPHRRSPRRPQRHPTPRERDTTGLPTSTTSAISSLTRRAHEPRRMKTGIQQRGMEAERLRVTSHVLGQAHLCVDLAVPAPRGAQALEHRAVREALDGPCLVETVQIHRLSTHRRPNRRIKLNDSPGLSTYRQHTRRVLRPRQLPLTLKTRVNRDRTPPRLIRHPHPHLRPHRAPLREHQRRRECQLLHTVAADLVTGPDRQLKQRRSRYENPAHHRVISQPGVRARRQPAGEQHAFALGQLHDAVEQRMPGLDKPDGRRVGAAPHTAGPERLVFEGVRGHIHPRRPGTGEEPGPVHDDPPHMQLRQCGDGRQFFGAILTEDRHGEGLVGYRLPCHRGEHAVRAQLQERTHALLAERPYPIGEAHGFPDMPYPVVGRAQLLRRRRTTGQIRHDPDTRRLERQALRHRAELVQHRIHQR